MDGMSIANPWFQKEWTGWKREMTENRRVRLWDRIRRWVKVEESDEDEGEDAESSEGDEEDNESTGKAEEVEVERGSSQEKGIKEEVEVKENEDEAKEIKEEEESKRCDEEREDEVESWVEEMVEGGQEKGIKEEVEVKDNEDEEKEIKEEGEGKKRDEEREDEAESWVDEMVEGEGSQEKGIKEEVEDKEMSEVDVEEEEVEREVGDEAKEIKEEGEGRRCDEEREDEAESWVDEMVERGSSQEKGIKEEVEVEREVKKNEDEENEIKEEREGRRCDEERKDEVESWVEEMVEGESSQEKGIKEEVDVEREVKENEGAVDDEAKEIEDEGESKKCDNEREDEAESWVEEEEWESDEAKGYKAVKEGSFWEEGLTVRENEEVDEEEEEWEAKENRRVRLWDRIRRWGEVEGGRDLEKELGMDTEMVEANERVDMEDEKEDDGEEKEVKKEDEVDEEEEWKSDEAKGYKEVEKGSFWEEGLMVRGNEEVDEEEEEWEVKKAKEMKEDEVESEDEEEHLEEQIPTENLQQNEGSPPREVNESAESMDEDSEGEPNNLERLKAEKLEDPRGGLFGSWTRKEGNEEDGSEKLTDEEGTANESWTTQEELQDDLESLQEEEDGDDSDEDEVKTYTKDDHPTDLFLALKEFKDASLLTDLTLSTADGKSFDVHSPVLAAVSALIWKLLTRRKVNVRPNGRRDDDPSAQRCSVSLGPEVDLVGLGAIVEFAYTGLVSSLNKDNVHQVRVAAKALGVVRVLDLCTQQDEEKFIKTGGQKKKERISAAQQMTTSLKSIKQLWVDRVGCDVVLDALGGSLHVHRVILAVSSDYFRGMFTLGMKESHQRCVTLPFLLASELEALIDCSYSGALLLSWRCVFELTGTSLQLQYQPALALCLDYLHQEINPDSCLDVISFAEAYGMTQLVEVADDFVLRQFQKVASTAKFKDLPARQLLKYLNSCSLCVPSELVVFKAVVAWIQAKPHIRLRLAKDLMKTIHFALMTFKEFKEVQSQNMWSDHNLAELYETIFEEFCSDEPALKNKCRIYLPKESLVLTGGEQLNEDLGSRSISSDLWFGNSLRNHMGVKKAMEWRKLREMPETARFSHEAAVLDGQLYVFGGKKYYGINDTLNSVYRYDPLQNSWKSLADMQEKRCSFSAVVLDGKIYAIGGNGEPDFLDSVERYCPTTNTWSFTSSLDLPLSGHVARVAQGQIFVSGGRNSDYLCLASMFLYRPETGSTYLANMLKRRAQHCMETLGDRLYVAGGVTTADNTTVIDLLGCEVYSPAEDSWTAFTSLLVPHVGAGSAVLEGKLYVLGGYSQEDYSDTKMVHRYDSATWRWENMGKMPGPNNDIRASVLCLPQHFRM